MKKSKTLIAVAPKHPKQSLTILVNGAAIVAAVAAQTLEVLPPGSKVAAWATIALAAANTVLRFKTSQPLSFGS